MEIKAVQDLSSVIKEHTERRTLDELAAQGKRTVRVVSGRKVFEIIEAIVDDTIRREAGEIARKDRDRIVGETRQQFDRVMKMQAEQEDEVRRHREAAAVERKRADDALRRVKELTERLDEERSTQAEREGRLLAEDQGRIEQAQLERRRVEQEREHFRAAAEEAIARATQTQKALEKLEAALQAEKQYGAETTRERDELKDRLEAQREKLTDRVSKAEEAARNLEAELAGMRIRIPAAEAEVEAARRRADRAEAEAERALARMREVDQSASRADAERAEARARAEGLAAEVEGLKRRAALLVEERDELVSRFESERGDLAGRQEKALAAAKEEAAKVRLELDRRTAEITELKRRTEEELRRSRAEAEEALRLAKTDAERTIADLTAKLARVTESAGANEGEKERLAAALAAEREKAAARERETTADYETRLARLSAERDSLKARFESERGELAGRQEEALAAAERRAAALAEEAKGLRDDAGRAKERIEKLEKLVVHLKGRDSATRGLIRRLESEVERLSAELAERDRQLAGKQDDETIARLHGEFAELKNLVRDVAGRKSGADEETVNALLSQLSSREERLEDRFSFHMDQTVDEITRALRVATMKPVDVEVEATDVLVDRIFDREGEMKTNLGVLSVEERTSGNGISGHLARLREARGKKAESDATAGD